MPDQTFVIIGASLAGGRAAEALRKEGFNGRIVLIGAEPDPPYERPPLSKEYLRGQLPREKLFIRKPEFWEEQQIELLLGTRATEIDPQGKSVTLEGGESIAFDRLLLATGGRERQLPVPGADLGGVYYLRTVADSERLAEELKEGRRAVVIGAGFIGSEVAASARQQGLEVSVFELAEVPLASALSEDIGRIYADIHRSEGVHLLTGEAVERFEGSARVERVVGSEGSTVDCDFVVVGVGIGPVTELAEAAGLAVDDGVLVDEYAETSVPGIYAAGDVARFHHPLLNERLRVEHWSNAQDQGAAAAKNMLGKQEPYVEIPWFWSDQYGLNLQYLGHATSWDDVVTRGSVEDRKFSVFYLEAGVMRAALAVNRFKDIRACREIIRRMAPVEATQLRDEAVELKSLVPET